MIMSYIWTIIIGVSIIAANLSGKGGELSKAISSGAQEGVNLSISLAGSICLWSGVGRLMEKTGITHWLSRVISPFMHRVFPTSQKDKHLENYLSSNICANFLGLGNAATPMGIQAAKRLADCGRTGVAGAELCRLIVLNTASIQLIPATVAAVRANLGSGAPFDILPAVWVTSVCSASAGLIAAWGLEKLWKE